MVKLIETDPIAQEINASITNLTDAGKWNDVWTSMHWQITKTFDNNTGLTSYEYALTDENFKNVLLDLAYRRKDVLTIQNALLDPYNPDQPKREPFTREGLLLALYKKWGWSDTSQYNQAFVDIANNLTNGALVASYYNSNIAEELAGDKYGD